MTVHTPDEDSAQSPGTPASSPTHADSGLLSLIAVGHYLERSLTVQQLRHDRGQGDRPFNAIDIVVACKDNLMQARVRRMSLSGLAALRQLPAPPILMMRGWLVPAVCRQKRRRLVAAQAPGGSRARLGVQARVAAALVGTGDLCPAGHGPVRARV